MLPSNAPEPPVVCSSDVRRSWRIVTSELLGGDSVPAEIRPTCRIEVNGIIQHIAFALGDSSHCRLPHRSLKRMSRVLHGSCVSLILLGLVTGYTEVYNLSDINTSGSSKSGYFLLICIYTCIYKKCTRYGRVIV